MLWYVELHEYHEIVVCVCMAVWLCKCVHGRVCVCCGVGKVELTLCCILVMVVVKFILKMKVE